MAPVLDRSAFIAAMEAFWDAPALGNDKGIEAAIIAYLDRMGLTGANATAVRRREALAAITASEPAALLAAE